MAVVVLVLTRVLYLKGLLNICQRVHDVGIPHKVYKKYAEDVGKQAIFL